MSWARLGAAAVMVVVLAGCGSEPESGPAGPAPIGQGTVVAQCQGAMGGPGSGDWGRAATAVGRFGVYGSGRDFQTALKEPVAGYRGLGQRGISGPILGTKTPFVVEGTEPVEVAIDPEDRVRAGLVVAPFDRPGPYASIRFIPCRDQPRTWWAGGWVLRDQDVVTVSVQQGDGAESQLVVGHP